jgi:hypothetical protein
MELTPAERVKLNAAILNSVKTGQPLSAELQSLYNQAAQSQANKAAGQVAGLLNPGFPTRNVSDVIFGPKEEGPFNLKRDFVKHSGPASSLPETRFEELYPSRVPVLNLEDPSYASAASPFGKEFDFTQAPVDIKDTETVKERAQRFLDQYFPGQKTGQAQVKNPQTNQLYGDELILHDAMHDFANVGNTLRGEELITIAENVGATPLTTNRVGLKGLTQQLDWLDVLSPAEAYEHALNEARQKARMGGRTLIQQRGAARGSSLFRDQNRVESFLSPPISREEFNTMAQRGREFYDQVHQNWNAFKRGGSVEWDDAPTREAFAKRNQALDEFMGNDPEKWSNPPRVITQRIAGGYNKGGIPYGNPLSLMNAPLVPTVNRDLWQQELNKSISEAVPRLQSVLSEEQATYFSPEQTALRELSKQDVGEGPSPPRAKDIVPISLSTARLAELSSGWSGPKDPYFFSDLTDANIANRAISRAIDEIRNVSGRGITAAVPESYTSGEERRLYLNPPNLGVVRSPDQLTGPAGQVAEAAGITSNTLLDAAAKAKQIEGYNKTLPKIKQAIRSGFNATTDLTGSIPLFDPAFRQAVEQGDARKAAQQVATEYAIGAAAAPVIGASAGLAQRLAPATTAAVLPAAAGALRVANPLAVVSQLGGSTKLNKKADEQAIKSQFARAEAARRRGGRWKFPTPFGTVTVPELGISESGGLFFR